MEYVHKTKWTDDLVKQEILKVKDSLKINRMPTRKEIELVTQNARLTSKISRSKGYYGWAKELGLPIKESQTTIGKQYEFQIKEILQNKGFIVRKMPQNYAFDLLVNENVKIDVKVAKPYISNKKFKYHTFNLYKKYATCDIYICICLDENEIIERILIIPAMKLKITQLAVGKDSKYNEFNNRFDYLKKYSSFYQEIY